MDPSIYEYINIFEHDEIEKFKLKYSCGSETMADDEKSYFRQRSNDPEIEIKMKTKGKKIH